MKKTLYKLEVECCEELMLNILISKRQYDEIIDNLEDQCQMTQDDETTTEELEPSFYESNIRTVETRTFLRTTTFIALTKETYKECK